MFRSPYWIAHALLVPAALMLTTCEASRSEDDSQVQVQEPAPCFSGDDFFAASQFATRIGYLASAELAGRLPGSDGDTKARKYISESLACFGLQPVGSTFSQPFVDSEGHDTANVIGVLPGVDPDLKNEIIVVSAHHDHLGLDEQGQARLGANDNASGVATLLAVAHALVSRSQGPKRTLVFATFGAEELGLEGSIHYVAHPPAGLPIKNTVFVVNMDMVGRYDNDDLLYALDAKPGSPGRAAVDAVRPNFTDLNLDVDTMGDSSDQVSFAAVGVPGLFFHTPDSTCYHLPCDTAEKIDYPHLSRTAELITAVVESLANGSLL